jgi:hypothetical protein
VYWLKEMTELAFRVATPDLCLKDEFLHMLTTKQLGHLCQFRIVDKSGMYYFYILIRSLTHEGETLLQQIHDWKLAYRLHPDKPHAVSLLQPSWSHDHGRWEIEPTSHFVKL